MKHQNEREKQLKSQEKLEMKESQHEEQNKMIIEIGNEKEKIIDCEVEIAKLTTEVPFGLIQFNGTARLIISEELGDKIYAPNVSEIYIDSSNASKTEYDISQILKDVTECGISN